MTWQVEVFTSAHCRSRKMLGMGAAASSSLGSSVRCRGSLISFSFRTSVILQRTAPAASTSSLTDVQSWAYWGKRNDDSTKFILQSRSSPLPVHVNVPE